jgi:predicted permease
MGIAIIWGVFVDNLLPILLCAGTGFVVGRTLKPDIKSASRLAFYVFSPCLVFESLERVAIPGGEFVKLALFTVLVSLIIGALSWLLGFSLKAGRKVIASLVVASMFVNSGNYGLAATKFSFGEEALARALACFVFGTVVVYTLGVLIASMGKFSIAQAFRKLLMVPAFYGLIAAAAVRHTGWQIPLMLVILGLQIAQTRTWPRNRAVLIGVAGFLQLIATPIVALGMAHLFGLTGPARQAAVLQASMPAAVATTVLAVEYDLDATLISGVVVLTTLLSPLTLTPLIYYLLRT